MLLLNENFIHSYYNITMSLVHAYQKTVSKQYILDYLDLFLGTVSAYAPQQGYAEEEKEEFWDLMNEMMGKIPGKEIVWLGGDLNGYLGQGNAGVEEVMGKFDLSESNAPGENIVDFAMRNKMAILNT